jgi:outer membrane protein insertion porin family
MRKLVFLLIFCCFSCSLLYAAENNRVAKVEAIGNERIDRGVVYNAVKTKQGDLYDPARVGEDLKNIYKTGFFSDVMVDVKDTDKGKVVTFIVVERPPVSAIYIAGNKKVKTADIREKLKIKSGSVLNIEKVKESVEEIRKLYAGKGYYAAKVNYEIDTKEGYKAELRFVIQEPQRAWVRKITFTGNKHLKASQIKHAMKTREKGWFSWFTGSGVLDEEDLEDDRKNIEALYHDNGYVKVKAGVPDVRISADGKTISIAVDIQEGDLHKISQIEFKGDIMFDEQETRKKLKSKEGSTFKSSLFQADVGTLTDMYQDKGYAFVDVAPFTVINDADKTVHVTFDIAKGSEVYFNRINIVGNIKTKDKVIRRELKFAEGDLYSSKNMKLSKRRLRNTMFFKSEELKTIKTDEPDKINLDVIVDEKPTGTLSLGVGYSTYEKIILTGTVSQDNIFGTGDRAALTASLSSLARLYNLTFIEPYTFDKNFTTTYNLFNTQRIFSTYDYKGSGGSVTVSRPLTEFIRGALGYRLQKMTVYNIESDAGAFITDQHGTSITSAVSVSLVRNTIDDILNPSRGSIASAMVEVAGGAFAGDNKFVKSVVSYGRYIPFYWDTIFFLRGTAGNITPYGGTTVPVFERFFVGGIQTMRGFKYGQAGPLDPSTGDVIGGTDELYFNTEWIFNVYKPAGLKGFIFFDYGKGFNGTGGFSEALRPAAGFGMRWFSPMGPVTVVLGFNLHKQPGEQAEVFDFSMGRPF